MWKIARVQRGKDTQCHPVSVEDSESAESERHVSSSVCGRQHECREGNHVRVIQQCLWKTAGVQRGNDTCHPMPVENSVEYREGKTIQTIPVSELLSGVDSCTAV